MSRERRKKQSTEKELSACFDRVWMYYIRDKDGVPRITVCIGLRGTALYRGMALMNPKDRLVKATGRIKAVARAVQALTWRQRNHTSCSVEDPSGQREIVRVHVPPWMRSPDLWSQIQPYEVPYGCVNGRIAVSTCTPILTEREEDMLSWPIDISGNNVHTEFGPPAQICPHCCGKGTLPPLAKIQCTKK